MSQINFKIHLLQPYISKEKLKKGSLLAVEFSFGVSVNVSPMIVLHLTKEKKTHPEILLIANHIDL